MKLYAKISVLVCYVGWDDVPRDKNKVKRLTILYDARTMVWAMSWIKSKLELSEATRSSGPWRIKYTVLSLLDLYYRTDEGISPLPTGLQTVLPLLQVIEGTKSIFETWFMPLIFIIPF